MVQYDPKPIADIGEAVTLEDGEPGPKNGTHEARPAQSEPSSLHPRHPGDGDEEEQIDDAHTDVTADHGNQPHHQQGMTGELGHGEGGADVPLLLVDAGGLPGQKQDKGDLDDLVGLEIQGEVGDDPVQGEPVPVAPRFLSQGGQEQENEAHIKGHQPLPALLHEQLEVHKGEDDIDDHADADGDGLDDHVPIIIIEIAGGAVDQGQAVAAGRET